MSTGFDGVNFSERKMISRFFRAAETLKMFSKMLPRLVLKNF